VFSIMVAPCAIAMPATSPNIGVISGDLLRKFHTVAKYFRRRTPFRADCGVYLVAPDLLMT
jgi:hypothetical protein